MSIFRPPVDKFTQMTQTPVPRLVSMLAVPTIISMLITSLYNMADTFFVGRIGTSATAAVGVALPLMAIIQAIGFTFGQGSGNYVSRLLGQQQREEAQRITSVAFYSSFLLAAALGGLGLLFLDPLVNALGATATSAQYTKDYVFYILIGAPFMVASLVLNNQFRFQGSAVFGMIGIFSGAALNIVLDPIFIFVFQCGVRGAALATILSQAVSACWVLAFLCCPHSILRIRRAYVRPDPRVMGKIAGLGVAPFIMQSTESLVTVVLNTGMQTYGGDLYVGSITIIQSIMQMIVMPTQGITQGVQPIMSYNYGAKNYRRVRQTFKRLLAVTMTVTCSAFVMVALIPGVLARIFTPEQELIQLVSRVMPLFFGGIWAFGAQMACQSTFMALGQARTSLFLALLRKVILLVPLALILPRVTGSVMGIYAAEPIADILASATTLTLFLSQRKKLLPTEKDAPKG